MISAETRPDPVRFEDLAERRGLELRAPRELRPPRDQIVALHKIDPAKSLTSLAVTWGLIALSFAAALVTGHWLVWIAAGVLIGRCQHTLAVLMHDAAHKRLLENPKWNDFVGHWLCARPIFSHLYAYRAVHLRHHKHLYTKQDPDLALSLPYPVSRTSLRRKLRRDVVGVSALVMRGYLEVDRETGRKQLAIRSWRRPLIPLAITAVLAAISPLLCAAYLLLWVLPNLTVYMIILRLRGIFEHAAVPDKDDPLGAARTIVDGNPVWSFFLAPFHVAYHLEHHLYPGVPAYNLPALHRALHETGHYDRANVVHGYRAALREVVTP